jgi:hypothetical protein
VSTTPGSGDNVDARVDRLGIEPGMVVQEVGYDDDVDHDLREAIAARIDDDLVDEDSDEVIDVLLLWYRDFDGDLVDVLLDAIAPLAATGVLWLLTPKRGHEGYVEPSDIAEAAPIAGLSQTSLLPLGDWTGARLVARRGRTGNERPKPPDRQ